MKNYLTLIPLLFISCILFAQYTAVPDTSFENYLETNGMGDGVPNNGFVLTSNINSVLELNVNGKSITDLTGIEDFIALEYLACGTNGLTSLDVTNNLALKVLGCDNNFLSVLDVSQNTALTLLYCVFNDLTTLNLSQNLNLEEVYCDWNFLSNLTISSPALLRLDCNYNQLTSLDLSSSSLLTELNANYNQLTNINISQNPNLYYLGITVNNLANLDVTQNQQLAYFNCSENNLNSLDLVQSTSLIDMSCTGNNISSLDVSQSPNLRLFRAYDNDILTSLDVRNGNNEGIEYFDATNPNLECIYVDDSSSTCLEDWLVSPNSTFVNNEQECNDLSIEKLTKDNFIMYPNPAENMITVITKTSTEYELITTKGIVVIKGDMQEGVNTIEITNVASGLYFLKMFSKKGEVTKKLIKK